MLIQGRTEFKERNFGIDFYYAFSTKDEKTSEYKFAEASDYIGGLVAEFFAPVERSTPEWNEYREDAIRDAVLVKAKQYAMDDGINMKVVFTDLDGKKKTVNVRWDNRKKGPKERK